MASFNGSVYPASGNAKMPGTWSLYEISCGWMVAARFGVFWERRPPAGKPAGTPALPGSMTRGLLPEEPYFLRAVGDFQSFLDGIQ